MFLVAGALWDLRKYVPLNNALRVTLLASDLPQGGIFKICHCPSYDNCDAASDFTITYAAAARGHTPKAAVVAYSRCASAYSPAWARGWGWGWS